MNRILGPGDRMGFEAIRRIGRGDALFSVEDPIVVGGLRFETGDSGLKLAGVGRSILEERFFPPAEGWARVRRLESGHDACELPRAGSSFDDRFQGFVGPPDTLIELRWPAGCMAVGQTLRVGRRAEESCRGEEERVLSYSGLDDEGFDEICNRDCGLDG